MPDKGTERQSDGPDQTEQKPFGLARSIWALVLSWEKRTKLKRAWRARNQGMIVITDRYPQDQIMGFNDGPLLSAWRNHRFGLLRALARWERVPYQWAERYQPDLVVKLRIVPETARRRNPEMSLEEVGRRVEAVASLRFQTRTVVVDANEPKDEVLLKVKRIVWEML